MKNLRQTIRGIVIGFILTELTFTSWLVDPTMSPMKLLARPAYAQQDQASEGDGDPLDPNEQAGEAADPTLTAINEALDALKDPITREGKLILDPRDATILRSHLDPESFTKNTSNVAAEDEETFKEFKTKLAELGFENEQGVAAVLSDQTKKQRMLELIQQTQAQVFTDRSRTTLVTLERMIEENREAVEIADFLDAIVFAAEVPGGKLVEKTKETFPLDRRVVDALAWLITPRKDGGGGHQRLKISRIWRTYTARDPKTGKPIPEKTKSKETEGADNVSLHAKGLAFDVSEIETVKCSKVVVKKGIIRRKVNRTRLPQKPIKVSYQTDEGVAQEQPPGLSFNELIQNLMQTALLDTLSEFDLTDVTDEQAEGSLRYATAEDLVDFVGRSLVEQLIGGKGLTGSSIRESIELFGRAALADRLGLPRLAIEGNQISEIETSVGRFTLEQRLRLPIGSLRGENGQEILTSAGRRRIEHELGLRDRTLQSNWNSRATLEEKLGQAMLETKLKLPLNAFAANDLPQLKRGLGERKFQLLIASSPNGVDELLGLDYGKTAALLLQGRVAEYKRTIGAKLIKDNWEIYRDYEDGRSKLDQAYGVPAGTMRQLLNGDQSALPVVGRETLTRALSTNDYDRDQIGLFFNDPSFDWQLPEQTINVVTGFRTGEFARVFSSSGGEPVFQRIGKSRLIQAIVNTPEAQRAIAEKERELTAEHPEILEAAASFEFRRQRFQDLQNRAATLDRLFKSASSNPAISSELNTIRSSINDILSRPFDFRSLNNAVKRISKSLDQLNAIVGPVQEVALRTQIEQELTAAYQDIEAIITGELPTQYRDIRLGEINPTGPGQRRSGSLISTRDLFDWINGKRPTKDLVLSTGARVVENSLELPPLAIFYTLKEREQSPDSFFRSVGRAQFEQFFGSQPVSVALAQNGPERIDAILGIGAARRSITARLASNEISQDQYFERVGKEVLMLRGVNLLGINVEFGGLVFTPYDIYDLLSGNGRPVYERIAAQQFERVLDLPQHVFWRLIKAPSTDDKQLAMAEVASSFFGNLLGLGPLPVTGVPEEVSGRYQVETALGLQPGTFRDSLDKVIERNQAINFAFAFMMVGVDGGFTIEGYDANEVQRAIQVLSLPETLTTVGPQEQARQYLASLNGDPVSNSGAWSVIERYRRGEVSDEQLELTVEQVDDKFRIEIGTTDKLIKGELSPAQYSRIVGGFSIVDNLARSSVLIDRLADALGLEGAARDNFNSQFPIVFNLLRRNSVTNIASWRPEDRFALYDTLESLFSLRFDSNLGVRQGTFASFVVHPENARKIFLTEAVFKLEHEMGIVDDPNQEGPLTRVYNAYANADRALKGEAAMQQAETELAFGIQREIFERTADRGNANGVSMPLEDIRTLIHGDMRFIGLVAAADMAGSLNKDRDGNLLPTDRQISYQVVADAFRAPPQEQAEVEAAGAQAYNETFSNYNPAVHGDDPQGFSNDARGRAMEDERGKLRSDRKKELQFRLIDNQLYKFDINIPSGFARAMFEGTTEGRTDALLNYTENLLNNHGVLGVPLPAGSLVAIEEFVSDPSQRNFDRLVSTGVLGTMDQFIAEKKLFGDFWLPGTAEALFRFGRTGQLGNINTSGTIVGLYGQWALVQVFQFMDAKMGWQIGSAAQIYFATQNFLHAKAAFAAVKAADIVGESTQFAQTRTNMTDAYAAMIAIVVTIVFAKEIAKVEQTIGLVPGTGALLISMGISALMGAAINPIVIGLFVLLNLFGFNRVKIFVLCTGNGYYPQLESTNPELDVGLGEFNGMSATEYREGLKQAARGRVNALISDMMEMPYYFVEKEFVEIRQDEPDFSTKPVQIFTARQEDLLAFFGSDRYKQVFNEDAPSKDNRQGIIISPLTTEYVHIGF